MTAIEKFDRVIESDDEDEGMSSEMAASIQFGGGDLDKGKPTDRFDLFHISFSDSTVIVDGCYSLMYCRKDLISEMISKSKQIKLEKTNAKEEQTQLTENLDGKLKALMMKGSLIQQKKGDFKNNIRDEYDDIVSIYIWMQ